MLSFFWNLDVWFHIVLGLRYDGGIVDYSSNTPFDQGEDLSFFPVMTLQSFHRPHASGHRPHASGFSAVWETGSTRIFILRDVSNQAIDQNTHFTWIPVKLLLQGDGIVCKPKELHGSFQTFSSNS